VDAVVMAGGLGRRLEPFTSVLPKPLMPLTDRPILDVILRQLDASGVERVHICVGHLGTLIESWVRHQRHYRTPIAFTYEDDPLGTAGALALIDGLDGTFIAMNGDILTTLDYRAFADEHNRSGALATVAVKTRSVSIEYGVVHTDDTGAIVRLEEKPQLSYDVSMGVYAFEAEIVHRHITPGERVDFPDLLLRASAAGSSVRAFPFDGYWRDIGNHGDYEAAVVDFTDDPARFVGAS
jgi:NDP-mannose synthase